MLAALRRCRLLILVLVALSPGASGTVLPVLQACPVNAPTMVSHAAHAMSGAASMPAHPAGHRGHSGHGDDYPCPGTCCPSAPVVAPTTYALAILRLGDVARPQAPPAATAPVIASRAELLPPSTAPPTLV